MLLPRTHPAQRTMPVACAVALTALAAPVHAQPTTLEPISGPGLLDPTALSADGLTVAGIDYISGRPFRWSAATGIELLGSIPNPAPIAISADGGVIIGPTWRWTQAAGVEAIGEVTVAAITPDGAVMVGYEESLGHELCPWPLSPPRYMPEYSARRQEQPGAVWHHVAGAANNTITKPGGVSADGLTIVGSTWTPQCWLWTSPSIACFWRDSNQVILSGAVPGTQATGISDDGAVVVGSPGFRWTAAGGFQNLWQGPAGVCGDGSVVVGTDGNWRALIWDQVHGTRDVVDVLASLGVPLPSLPRYWCSGISGDGRRLLITGRESDNTPHSWIAFLGDPVGLCYANCDASTASPILNITDFSCFLNRFAAGDNYANCDNSTTPPALNVADFICFLNRFAAGCS